MPANRFRSIVELYEGAYLTIKAREVSGGIELKACDVNSGAELARYIYSNKGKLDLLKTNVSGQELAARVYPNIADSCRTAKRDLAALKEWS